MSEDASAPEVTEKQRRVLEAAMDVFAERGFGAASTAEIAKRAGVAEGTIFKNYKTKKELLIGVIAPVLVKYVAPSMLGEVREILHAKHATVEDFLRAMYTNRIEFTKKHQRVLRIALQEVPFHAEVRELAKATVTAQILPDALALIERFQREGKVRAGRPGSIIRLIVGTFAIYAIARHIITPEREWDDTAEIDLMATVIAKGLAPD